MKTTEYPPAGMITYGQRLGARNADGLANWADEVIDAPATGMTNVVSHSPHPRDGLRRRVEILMRNEDGQWLAVADAFYDGRCRMARYEIRSLALLQSDARLYALVARYADHILTLDCLSLQREYPLQSPWHPWLLLRPGDVEVVG
jgi:hypothetical protein